MILEWLLCFDLVVDPDVLYHRLYVAPPGFPDYRGECLAHTCRRDEACLRFTIEEGSYTLTLVRVYPWGEEDWRRARRFERTFDARSTPAPAAPSGVAIAHMGETGEARFRVDHAVAEEPDAVIEVIEGSSVLTGRLVYRGPQHKRSADEWQVPASVLSRGIALDGSGREASRRLHVRAVSLAGVPGDAAPFVELPFFDRPNTGRVAICSLVSGSLSNISAPAATAAWEFVAGVIRNKQVPATDDADDADWGTVDAGALSGVPVFCEYLPEAIVESSEVNLGAVKCFWLEACDDLERESAIAPDIPLREMDLPLDPGRAFAGQPYGPAWYSAEYSVDLKPRRSLEECRWEVKFGDMSPITMPYRPLVNGEWIKAQYVRVRRVMRDPMGLHRLAIEELRVHALFPFSHDQGEATKAGGNTDVTVNTRENPTTGAQDLFTNQLVPTLTFKGAPSLPAGARLAVAAVDAAAGTFDVELQDEDGVALTDEVDFYWRVDGY